MTASRTLVSDAFRCAAERHRCRADGEKPRKAEGVMSIEEHFSRASSSS